MGVRIDLPQYRELKAWFEGEATRQSTERLARVFYELPFEPYYLVRRQQFNLLRAVNRLRQAAGLPLVPKECIWLKRRPVKPFGDMRLPDTDIGKSSDSSPRLSQGSPEPFEQRVQELGDVLAALDGDDGVDDE